jgi:BirA family biotin operon repressor/biotin-[acetyl-CoA-carboxylase] ligase
VPADVAEAVARARPRLGALAAPLVWYDDIPSTNSEALAMAEAGVPEGWTVGAERQSAGRGRHGRAWASPPGPVSISRSSCGRRRTPWRC